jgi:hypothetical protein
MGSSTGDLLIQELLDKPEKFKEEGKAYQLLQEYFQGFSKKTLPPLLKHKSITVQGAAVWIASELGKDGRCLLSHVIPLLDYRDRYLRYHALEVVMVCSVDENVDKFFHVVRSLESDDEVIRVHGMRLVSNASQSQLSAGLQHVGSIGHLEKIHKEGLSALQNVDQQTSEKIQSMIEDQEPLVRKYGVMIGKKLFRKFPDLIAKATTSPDSEVSKFAKEVIENVSI